MVSIRVLHFASQLCFLPLCVFNFWTVDQGQESTSDQLCNHAIHCNTYTLLAIVLYRHLAYYNVDFNEAKFYPLTV